MMPTDSYGMGTATGAVDVIGGFDVNTMDKEGNVIASEYHGNVNDAGNAAAGIDAAIKGSNSAAYKSFFQGASDYAANTDMGLGGGCPDGDCDDAKKSVVWKDQSTDEKLKSVNTAIGAASIGNGIKNEIIESAIKESKAISGASDYLKLSKNLGTGLGVFSAGINTYQYRSGEMSGFEYSVEMIST